ncbi:MAG: putative fluoride ion transporter CrcB [Phycisphaerae bacterium]|nr:MAG: putative fluoride ion transporter CrcB [Phycisphaerae bacterium]
MPETQAWILKPAFIFLGAGAGGLLRYWLGGMIQAWWGPTFPLGTLVVNVSGCLVMGFLAAAWYGPILVRDDLRATVLIGILGGYTTFSTFGRETLSLAHDGEWGRASLYVLGSVVLSLVGVWFGSVIAGKFYGTGAP